LWWKNGKIIEVNGVRSIAMFAKVRLWKTELVGGFHPSETY
jgi:hypothetical protein